MYLLFTNLVPFLTVYLGTILVTNEINAQKFCNNFIITLYIFRALCTHHQGSKFYYTASGIITPVNIRPMRSSLPTFAPDVHLNI